MVAVYATTTRPLDNGGYETLSLVVAHRTLLFLNVPGIALMWLALVTSPFDANWSRTWNYLLLATGNTIFYSFSAYLVVRLTGRWRRT